MSYSGQGAPWDGGPPGAEADYANDTAQMYRPHQELSTSQSIMWPSSVPSYGQYPAGYSYTDTYQSSSQYATQPSGYAYGTAAAPYYPPQTSDHNQVYPKTYPESRYEQASRPFDKSETNYQRSRRSRSRSPYDSRYSSSRRNRSSRQRSISLSPNRRASRHVRSHKSPSNERFKSRRSRERSESNRSRDRSHSKSVHKKTNSRKSFSKSPSSSCSKSASSSRDSCPRTEKSRSASNSSKRSNRSAKVNSRTKSVTRSPSTHSERPKKLSKSDSSVSSRDGSTVSEKKYDRTEKSNLDDNSSSTSASNDDSESSEASDKSTASQKKRSPKIPSPVVENNYKNSRRSYSRNRARSNSYEDYRSGRKENRSSKRRTKSRERSPSISYNKRERTPRRSSSGYKDYKDKVASAKDRPKRGEHSTEPRYRSRSPSHFRHFRGRERSTSKSKRYRKSRSPSLPRQSKFREKAQPPGKSAYDSRKPYTSHKKTYSYPRKSRSLTPNAKKSARKSRSSTPNVKKPARKSRSSTPNVKKSARKSRSRSKSRGPPKTDAKPSHSNNKTKHEGDKSNSDADAKSPSSLVEESGFNFENLPPPDEKMFLKSKPDLRAELEKHLKMQNKANLHDQSITSTVSMPQFKNDGSFLEMFKKMQETAKTGEASQSKMEDAKTTVIKKPALPFIGKRRGGRVLKTGLVKKAKAIDEQLVDNAPKDAWSLYMQEVKKYRETSCEEERKTRPLVK